MKYILEFDSQEDRDFFLSCISLELVSRKTYNPFDMERIEEIKDLSFLASRWSKIPKDYKISRVGDIYPRAIKFISDTMDKDIAEKLK